MGAARGVGLSGFLGLCFEVNVPRGTFNLRHCARAAPTFLLLAFASSGCGPSAAPAPPVTKSAVSQDPAPAAPGPTVADAYEGHRSHVWVEDSGTVTRLLREDTKRPRHERFVVRMDGGDDLTVMIAHNIDLAPRVPCKRGDTVSFRGEYIWSEQGGIVHWTHRDPQGGKDSGGWIRWRDFVYR